MAAKQRYQTEGGLVPLNRNFGHRALSFGEQTRKGPYTTPSGKQRVGFVLRNDKGKPSYMIGYDIGRDRTPIERKYRIRFGHELPNRKDLTVMLQFLNVAIQTKDGVVEFDSPYAAMKHIGDGVTNGQEYERVARALAKWRSAAITFAGSYHDPKLKARVDEEVDFNVIDFVRFWTCKAKNRAGVRVRFSPEFLEACRNGFYFHVQLRNLIDLNSEVAQSLYLILMNWYETSASEKGLTRDVRGLCASIALDRSKPLWELKRQLTRGLKQVQALLRKRHTIRLTYKYRGENVTLRLDDRTRWATKSEIRRRKDKEHRMKMLVVQEMWATQKDGVPLTPAEVIELKKLSRDPDVRFDLRECREMVRKTLDKESQTKPLVRELRLRSRETLDDTDYEG